MSNLDSRVGCGAIYSNPLHKQGSVFEENRG